MKEVMDGALEAVGSVPPATRRIAAYAGVGILGVAGLVEWPVAAAGAAVVWLTQQNPGKDDGADALPAGEQQRSSTAPATSNKRAKGARKSRSPQTHGRRDGAVPIDAEAPSGQAAG
ncbi:hypothetical protein ACIQU6_20060 [Streptomyces sp. NPDC090442]|uniref:hypothetical protein n=1 Tax=Streptomyces sp. NPDC090442 TaxID=3365962 RepID=UPI0037FD3F5B